MVGYPSGIGLIMRVNLLLFDSAKRCVVIKELLNSAELPSTITNENEDMISAAHRVIKDIIDVPVDNQFIKFHSSVSGVVKEEHDVVFSDYYLYYILPAKYEGRELNEGMIWYEVPSTVMFDVESLEHAELMLTILSVYKNIN